MAADNKKTFEAEVLVKGVFEGDGITKAIDLTDQLKESINKINREGGIKADSEGLKSLRKAVKEVQSALGDGGKKGKGIFGGIFDGFKSFDGKSIIGLATSIGALVIGIKSLKDAIVQAYNLFKSAERIKADLMRSGYSKAEAESAYGFLRNIPRANGSVGLERNVDAFSYLASKKNLTGGDPAIKSLVLLNSFLSDYSSPSLAYSGDLQGTIERLSLFSNDLNYMAQVLDYADRFNEATSESFDNYIKMVEQIAGYSAGKANPKEIFESATRAVKGFGTYSSYEKVFEAAKGFTEGSELGKTLQALLSESGKPFHSFAKMMEYYGGDVNKALRILLETVSSASSKGNLTGAENILLKDLVFTPMQLEQIKGFLSNKNNAEIKTKGIIERGSILNANMPMEVNEQKVQRIKDNVAKSLTGESIMDEKEFQKLKFNPQTSSMLLGTSYSQYIQQEIEKQKKEIKDTYETFKAMIPETNFSGKNANIYNNNNTFNIQSTDPYKAAEEVMEQMQELTGQQMQTRRVTPLN